MSLSGFFIWWFRKFVLYLYCKLKFRIMIGYSRKDGRLFMVPDYYMNGSSSAMHLINNIHDCMNKLREYASIKIADELFYVQYINDYVNSDRFKGNYVISVYIEEKYIKNCEIYNDFLFKIL